MIKEFKEKRASEQKLLSYGFYESEQNYAIRIPLFDSFYISVTVVLPNKMDARVFDEEAEEEYFLHLTKDAYGAFVGKVRSEYERVLGEIENECFISTRTFLPVTSAVKEYISEAYGDALEYLWQDENAIWRRKDSGKWYGVLMVIKGSKLGLDSDEKQEIMNLHLRKEKVQELLNEDGFFPAYHMNKKSWISVMLDGRVEKEKIFPLIDISYALAKK